jgi:outer membrane protein OmpA-like peptidoglycan-associated protein
LQKGKEYVFRGIISAKLNPKLIYKAGICLGQKFYVPERAFSKEMHPDSIKNVKPIPNTSFFQFEYNFTATGSEKYLTFGSYIEEDTTGAKKKLTGTQTVSIVLDNFQLIPADEKETTCPAFALNKKTIYDYNFRHREMDYSLFGRGELNIVFDQPDSSLITKTKKPEPPAPLTDTLKLGDVLFDFNKALLKPEAVKILTAYFINNKSNNNIDSVYIEGHTDSVGTDKRNLQLSQQRCESVKDWLVINNIIAPGAFYIHPFGKTRPIATNKTAAGRTLNRRVEIVIFRTDRQP